MSDAPQGAGWWQASDGRWYPPESHPDARSQQPPPGPSPTTPPSAGPASPPPGPTTPPSGPPPGQPPMPGGPAAGQPPGPPSGPPPGSATAGQQPPAGGKKRRTGRLVLIVVLVLVLAGGAFGVFTLLSGSGDEVVLEPIGEQRVSAFTDSVAGQPGGSLLEFAAEPDATFDAASTTPVGYRSAPGSLPGMFAGEFNAAACDVDVLAASLAADPERADAWAGVLSIAPGDIPGYLARTTPMYLASDARVVNHGYEDGDVVARDAVMQRGSAVLVDPLGVPRVDCVGGSPLLPADPVEGETFSGDGWVNFERERVILIAQAPAELDTFEVRDIDTGELFVRPVGSRGEADVGEATDAPDETDDSATVDMVDDGPIEFDTVYNDTLTSDRNEARYLLDAPDGAVMTLRVANARESERRVFVELFSEGSTFASNRIDPGADGEFEIVLGHAGGAPFELMFSEGPAAFEFIVELAVQDDAGQGVDAGDDFASGLTIESGASVDGRLGGADGGDVFLLDLPAGHEFVLDAEVTRDSERRAFFQVVLDGETIFSERVNPGASTSTSVLFGSETDGVLEIFVTEGGAFYSFTAAAVDQADGGQEGDAGDSLADAREAPIGEELSGEVGQDDAADWYLFDAPGEAVDVDVAISAESDRRVFVQIQNADGSNVVAQRVEPGTQTTFSFEAEPDTEHRIQVSEGRGSYTFEIRGGTLDDEG